MSAIRNEVTSVAIGLQTKILLFFFSYHDSDGLNRELI